MAVQFIFRYVFLTIALWVPSVVGKTARKLPWTRFLLVIDLLLTDFYYVQKGLWYGERRS